MKEYVYYWYHHMMPSEERKRINQTIQNKDYFNFIELYKYYSIKAIQEGSYLEEFQTWIPMTYLPSTISVFDSEDKNFYDSVLILDKDNFEKITYSECECG